MTKEELLSDIKRRLNQKNIYELRQIGRAAGVQSPSSAEREAIISGVVDIACGIKNPAEPSKRGAPPKSAEYDRALIGDVQLCRSYYLSETPRSEPLIFKVAGGDFDSLAERDECAAGLLDYDGERYFLRADNSVVSKDDIFVNSSFVEKYNLRLGDKVACRCKSRASDGAKGLISVEYVNDVLPRLAEDRRSFSELTPIYPTTNLKLNRGGNDAACKIIDLMSPLAYGQRVVVLAPENTAPGNILLSVAGGVAGSGARLVVLLIDCYPEAVTRYKRSLSGAEFFVSGADGGATEQIRVANLALEYCKRMVEYGADCVLVCDDLRGLARAVTLSTVGGAPVPDMRAVQYVRKFFLTARAVEEGGSLTIITAVRSASSDPSESALCNALADAGGAKIYLSGELAALRVLPEINVRESYSTDVEKIISADRVALSVKIRSGAMSDAQAVKLFCECDEEQIKKRFN